MAPLPKQRTGLRVTQKGHFVNAYGVFLTYARVLTSIAMNSAFCEARIETADSSVIRT